MKVRQSSPPHGKLTVTLIAGSAAHQKSLADFLAREDILRRAVRLSPDLDILEPNSAGDLKLIRRFASYRVVNRSLWAIWRRLPWVKRQAPSPVIALSSAVDKIISRWLPPTRIFHGVSGVCLASIRRARRLGAITLIENGTLHPVAWQLEVLADCATGGLPAKQCERVIPPMQMRRREREYETCNKILVYSSAAWRSFQPFPYAHKAVVVHPGIDHRLFSPSRNTCREPIFRVCYVGRIEAAKGLLFLVEAWKRLALDHAELVLAGRVLPELADTFTKGLPVGIRLAGILTSEEVANLHRESDVFVFPSMNEGLSLALLEAMSSGLAVIACSGTGAEDCITAGKEGLLVLGRKADAIAGAIQWFYDHPDERRAMGAAARMRIEEHFTISHYQRRIMELYQSLVAGTPP
ncbi:MAG TPA: glycosyltransferase family 4 protein [Bryobacteraceae bacterium]|jgi:glycosyltransferase involved in cell wall biosynthesis